MCSPWPPLTRHNIQQGLKSLCWEMLFIMLNDDLRAHLIRYLRHHENWVFERFKIPNALRSGPDAWQSVTNIQNQTGKSSICISKISRGRVRMVWCIIWCQSLGRGQLTTVKLCTCLSFPPRRPCCFYSIVLVLVPHAYAFFFFFLALWRHEIRRLIKNLDYLYVITTERTTCRPAVLRTVHVCAVLIRMLHACGHFGLSCPICMMRECVFLYVFLGAGCWVLICGACRNQVEAPLVPQDWVQVQTMARSFFAPFDYVL